MPGPHNANIRGNWIYTKIWGSLVDLFVICLLFSQELRGITLWYDLKKWKKNWPNCICLIGFLSIACINHWSNNLIIMDITKYKSGFIKWNLKIHIYLGLCLLFFIVLIGFSGLLLNHHWEFAKFWENRKEIKYDKTIQISREREQYALVNEIMNELNLHGSMINP